MKIRSCLKDKTCSCPRTRHVSVQGLDMFLSKAQDMFLFKDKACFCSKDKTCSCSKDKTCSCSKDMFLFKGQGMFLFKGHVPVQRTRHVSVQRTYSCSKDKTFFCSKDKTRLCSKDKTRSCSKDKTCLCSKGWNSFWQSNQSEVFSTSSADAKWDTNPWGKFVAAVNRKHNWEHGTCLPTKELRCVTKCWTDNLSMSNNSIVFMKKHMLKRSTQI